LWLKRNPVTGRKFENEEGTQRKSGEPQRDTEGKKFTAYTLLIQDKIVLQDGRSFDNNCLL
jgi:hypothetical protein